MARTRISTTVDHELLMRVRALHPGATDALIIDDALTALLARERAAAIDAAYRTAYETHPIEEPDAWGDLGSFHHAVAASR
ncbi:MAG: DUF2191 domain-containing protein [Actinobacteria bacterium]|jgi:hypothetical protein|uniref:Unannotated protein n=1 Tax=freshwater metagenome TaxID=449393 RepID=A0A6J7N908_9ZZZZ|nr:DUF2191 domain-containing protein [Actinomycetota bacterium]MSW77105.1 DUF2191 domain-containing protein [Actinomycetota bacterium]MSX54906.1 DUF2191 domain-containing protein [Actinomycetota bacterium]MSX92615.1 DUF2191 domain-containing protein [Actinomycetota bacterium]MSZ83027.1 DUF2191 domain-containing protein [Actinomycetota bacterium]